MPQYKLPEHIIGLAKEEARYAYSEHSPNIEILADALEELGLSLGAKHIRSYGYGGEHIHSNCLYITALLGKEIPYNVVETAELKAYLVKE